MALRSRRMTRRNPFESRTQLWREVGLGAEVDRERAKRARGGMVLIALAIAAVLVLFSQRRELFPGLGTEVRIATVVLLVLLGWSFARRLGEALAPLLLGRLEPGSAGTVGFLVRLGTVLVTLFVALRIAGVQPETLAVGGAFTAVVLGLAAQQTIGNVFAGAVLLSTRPFRVGDRVRLTGGALAGSVEGIVGSLGLFYTTLVSGASRTMIPNSAMLQLAVTPLRDSERVSLQARFDAGVTPSEVQRTLESSITVPLRYPPEITLEELDRDEVVVRIEATPASAADGSRLASEVLAAVRSDAATSNGSA